MCAICNVVYKLLIDTNDCHYNDRQTALNIDIFSDGH